MSLELQQYGIRSFEELPNRYIIYLRTGKILKTVFIDKPYIGAILLGLAYLYMRFAGLRFHELKRLGGKLLQIHKRLNAIVVEFKEPLTEYQIKWIEEYLFVDIEPIKEFTACLDTAVTQTGVDKVWVSNHYEGKGIVVAVGDTGIDDRHTDLQGRVIKRRDFAEGDYPLANSWWKKWLFKVLDWKHKNPDYLDPVGHGTHCAGIVGGNGATYRGVAPKVKFIDVRVLDKKGRGSTDKIIKGMSWAASQGADIISLSLGGWGDPNDAISREANALAQDGIVVVVAAGNSGPKEDTVASPGGAEQVITVGAVDKATKLTFYSSRGPVVDKKGNDLNKPDILAPGGGVSKGTRCRYESGIISVKSRDTEINKCSTSANEAPYQRMSGTSMATPHIAGICALLLEASKLPKVRNRNQILKDAIKQTARNLNYTKNEQGAGLVDVPAAIKKLKETIGG